MAIRNILKNGDDTLRKKSREVVNFDERLKTLLDDLLETLKVSNGAGLAAPQVGVLRRVAVVDIGEGTTELVNPVIISQEGENEGLEGCLSVPEKYGVVVRPKTVTVRAFDRNGKEFEVTGSDFFARALCHEIDHLDGKLFIDIATELLDPEEIEEANEERSKK